MMKMKIFTFTKFAEILRRRMQSSAGSPRSRYQHAIEALNNLQSNAGYIQTAPRHDEINHTLEETHMFLSRSGISLDRLDTLPMIHIAGTKGKGSTSAFLESILRGHGLRTGLYTSPHLVTVLERIRLNGASIPESTFTDHFWKVYHTLQHQQSHPGDMPPYFKFLTILMFHIFLNSPIDVAIIEVGIGGEYDSTNVIRSPACIGVTSLGLDHMRLLGNDIASIAWQKSGIFKENSPAFTVKQQKEAMEILKKRANEKKCLLKVARDLNNYSWRKTPPDLGISGEIQYENAALAVELAGAFMRSGKFKDKILDFGIVEDSLRACRWPGRTQILRGTFSDYYLDGAHTVESMRNCIAWFMRIQKDSRNPKVLIFNCIGERNFRELLDLLRDVDFQEAHFVPNVSGVGVVDQVNLQKPKKEQMAKCREHRDYWGDCGAVGQTLLQVLGELDARRRGARFQVLITGSLHLVGAALAVLDPELSMTTKF